MNLDVPFQRVTKTTTNGVTTYSHVPGLASKVQGEVDNMVNGVGRSGTAVANGIETVKAVAIATTGTVSKTSPVQRMGII